MDSICTTFPQVLVKQHDRTADIVGRDREFLRGPSKVQVHLQIHPVPSRYYEVGRFLTIPMAPPIKGTRDRRDRFVLDFTGILEWTAPKISLDPKYLETIASRIVIKEYIGAVGLPTVAP